MSRRWLISGVVVVVALLGTAAPSFAAAATPISAGSYYGNGYFGTGDFQNAAALLVVSRDGKTLVPGRGAYASAWSPCRRQRGREDGGANVALTSSARIRPDGSFRVVERQGKTTLRMRGRFTRSWRVRLVLRVRARPERPRDPRRPGFCTAGPSVIKLNHLGVAPFRDCRTHPAETVAQTSEGRVFLHYRRSGPSLLKRAYGCLFSTNERVFIAGDDEEGIWPRQFRLAGPYVGYEVAYCGGIGCSSAFYVKDLRNGAERELPNLPEGVTDFVVHR